MKDREFQSRGTAVVVNQRGGQRPLRAGTHLLRGEHVLEEERGAVSWRQDVAPKSPGGEASVQNAMQLASADTPRSRVRRHVEEPGAVKLVKSEAGVQGNDENGRLREGVQIERVHESVKHTLGSLPESRMMQDQADAGLPDTSVRIRHIEGSNNVVRINIKEHDFEKRSVVKAENVDFENVGFLKGFKGLTEGWEKYGTFYFDHVKKEYVFRLNQLSKELHELIKDEVKEFIFSLETETGVPFYVIYDMTGEDDRAVMWGPEKVIVPQYSTEPTRFQMWSTDKDKGESGFSSEVIPLNGAEKYGDFSVTRDGKVTFTRKAGPAWDALNLKAGEDYEIHFKTKSFDGRTERDQKIVIVWEDDKAEILGNDLIISEDEDEKTGDWYVKDRNTGEDTFAEEFVPIGDAGKYARLELQPDKRVKIIANKTGLWGSLRASDPDLKLEFESVSKDGSAKKTLVVWVKPTEKPGWLEKQVMDVGEHDNDHKNVFDPLPRDVDLGQNRIVKVTPADQAAAENGRFEIIEDGKKLQYLTDKFRKGHGDIEVNDTRSYKYIAEMADGTKHEITVNEHGQDENLHFGVDHLPPTTDGPAYLEGDEKDNDLKNVPTMLGLGGNDHITAHPGGSVMVGGKGNDVLIGGDGVDTFVLYYQDMVKGDRDDPNFDRLTPVTNGNYQDEIYNYGRTDILNFKDVFQVVGFDARKDPAMIWKALSVDLVLDVNKGSYDTRFSIKLQHGDTEKTELTQDVLLKNVNLFQQFGIDSLSSQLLLEKMFQEGLLVL